MSEGTKAYQKKLKDITESFHQNASSVQEMISGVEGEIFQLLKRKEKLRDKLVKVREDKRLAPTMQQRTAVLLDDISDFANLYNLRQPEDTRISEVPVSSSERPVLGDGPKLSRQIVIEMNPAEVVAQSPLLASPSSAAVASPASSTKAATAAAASSSSPASTSSKQQQQQEPQKEKEEEKQSEGKSFQNSTPSSPTTGAGAGTAGATGVDQPSVACSFSVSFSPLKPPPFSKSTSSTSASSPSSTSQTPPASPATAAASASFATAAPDELPAMGIRFRLLLPPNSSAENVRQKLQKKVDTHLEEIRQQIDSAQKTFSEAVDEDEKAEGTTDNNNKEEEDDSPKFAEVSDLLWKSLRLIVHVQRGPIVYQATNLIVTIYVYRILSEEQKKKQEEIEKKVEDKLNSAIKEAKIDEEYKDSMKEYEEAKKGRGYRQLCAVARLCADCGVSITTELQVTAASSQQQQLQQEEQEENEQNEQKEKTPNNGTSDNDEGGETASSHGENENGDSPSPSASNANTNTAATNTTTVTSSTNPTATNSNNNNNDDSNNNKSNNSTTPHRTNKEGNSAEDILARVLESAPRVEGALKEAMSAVNEASSSSVDEVKKIAIKHADALYRDSLLPAVQRNVDPDDKVIKLINSLVKESSEKFRVLSESPSSPQQQQQQESATTTAASSSDKKEEGEEEESPFVISLNGHHAELNNIPKQLVRQTANMLYDYFLDTTESLSGRAYIGMCRRRTLAGVALYDALHFNIMPLAQSSKSETSKSACAFFHFEKLLRAAIMGASERAVESVVEARERVSKAMDSTGTTGEGLFSKTTSTLKLAMRIGKRLFNKFREERGASEDDESQEGNNKRTNAFAFVNGQVCCCDDSRPIEIEIYMPDSQAICTFKVVMRPAVPEFLSPRIRPRRQERKNPQIQAAAMQAAACRGKCTTAIPEFGLQVGEAFADLWINQINDVLNEKKEGEEEEKQEEQKPSEDKKEEEEKK